MAQQSGGYWSSCFGKERHRTRRLARIVRTKMGKQSGGGRLQIYECFYCQNYHLGHRQPGPMEMEAVALVDEKHTVVGNIACLDTDVKRLLMMLQRDCEALLLPFPRYAEYREVVEGMGWDITRLNILLSTAPATAGPTTL